MTVPVGYNIPGAPNRFVERYLCECDQYLQSPPLMSGAATPSSWYSEDEVGFYTQWIEEFYDVRYIVQQTSTPPASSAFIGAPAVRGTFVTLALPEGANNYVAFRQADVREQFAERDNDIIVFGPYNIDNTPPIGTIVVASGALTLTDQNTYVEVTASDAVSGVDAMYLDGDIEDGTGIREWVSLSSPVDIVLVLPNGQKTVTVRFRDIAGNISETILDTVFLGATRYFFYSMNTLVNAMARQTNTAESSTNRLEPKTDNIMEESSDA